MNKHELRFRQVHLDFHTSEHVDVVGKDFNPDEFAKTLKDAHVNSITCFAKCHHGWLYYDSEVFPERIHPKLFNKNLLDDQIKACHMIDINVPIYITVGWDYYTANEHPEWLVVNEKGTPTMGIFETGFYHWLCLNSPYRELVKEQVREVLTHFGKVDGLFFDMLSNEFDCSCKFCRKDMIIKGIDPTDKQARKKHYSSVVDSFKRELTSLIREYSDDCSIFYNADSQKELKDTCTHFEIEALPGDKWGYMDFLVSGLYARNLGKDFLGMTGKFHTSWADFHSFKNKAALEYECLRMLALNAKCLVGDQLEPNGKLSKPVYSLIGSVYSQVEESEPWCEEANHISEIAIVVHQDMMSTEAPGYVLGATKMLVEGGHLFDIVNPDANLSKYKVLILPDEICIEDKVKQKLELFIKQGGSVIASYESGLNKDKTNFVLDGFGISLIGKAKYSPDFIIPKGKIGKGLEETEHVMYMNGMEVRAKEGTEVLAYSNLPYFNRTWEHFCSHRHFPSSGKRGYDSIVKNNNVIYFMHPIFTQYNENAPLWCKKMVLNALDILLPDRIIRHSGPSTMEVAINEQKHKNRFIIHALHYIPVKRSNKMEIIEDVIPLHNIKFSINLPNKITGIKLVPSGCKLEYFEKEGRIKFELAQLNGHEMIELSYDN